MIAVQQTPAQPTDPAVEDMLDRLPMMPIAQLRLRYREVFRTDPPKAFGPDLLRRSIAHRIQEKAYGGLPPWTAMVASITSPVAVDGLLIVTFVVVTCVDDAVARLPELIEATATPLTHIKIAAPIAAAIKTPTDPLLKKETVRFFI